MALDRILTDVKRTRETGGCPAKQTVAKQSANRVRGASRSFVGEGKQATAPGDRRKTGLRVVGGGTGRYGVSPLEWVAPHEVGAQGKTFPAQTSKISQITLDQT